MPPREVGSGRLTNLAEERVRTAVRVAASRGTAVPLEELSELMPADGPDGAAAVRSWLEERAPLAEVVGDSAVAPGTGWDRATTTERRRRGIAYLASARSLVGEELQGVHPSLLCVGVTGSTAYGEPEAGEDCDFLAITREGALWPTLAYVFLRLRLRRRDGRGVEPPVWCFNYAVDARAARSDYSRPRGFLFAREALVAQIVHGGAFYRGLLAGASWMATEAPRMFLRWRIGAGDAIPSEPERAAWPLRLLNWVLYPWIAAYLQGQALRRNRWLSRAGRQNEAFVVRTALDRFMVVSAKFDQLKEEYVSSSRLAPTEWARSKGRAPASVDPKQTAPARSTRRAGGDRGAPGPGSPGDGTLHGGFEEARGVVR